jgi:hypothetical protein
MAYNIFVLAGIVSVVFVLMKLAEQKFVDKESKPMKLIVRDALVVYISVVSGDFILDQLNPFIEVDRASSTPEVFVDNPDF